MCLSESEHHQSVGAGVVEEFLARHGGDVFRQCARHNHHGNDGECRSAGEHGFDVDEHTHTNQEIGDEDSVSDEFCAVHERGRRWYETVEDESAEESAEDALDTTELSNGCGEEDHGEYEDVLDDIVGLVTEEPSYDAGEDEENHEDVQHEPHAEPHPFEDVVCAS